LKPNNILAWGVGCALALTLAVPAQAQSAKRGASKGASLEAPVPGAVTVSDYEYNTFVFPDFIKRIHFPAGSPVVGKPVYLGENKQVMLQFSKGQDRPVQMIVEMDGGTVVTLRVVPKAVPGVTHAVNGARVRAASPARKEGQLDDPLNAAPRGEDIELLKQVVARQEAPSGYDPVKLPNPTRFDKFSVIPLAGWTDGTGKRIFVFSLVGVPGQTAVVSPPQFYRPGITAVMLDGDVVDATNSPQLYVVEEARDE
jgi:hypothetical protein